MSSRGQGGSKPSRRRGCMAVHDLCRECDGRGSLCWQSLEIISKGTSSVGSPLNKGAQGNDIERWVFGSGGRHDQLERDVVQ